MVLLGWVGNKRVGKRNSRLEGVGGVGFGIPCTGERVGERGGYSVNRSHTTGVLWVCQG